MKKSPFLFTCLIPSVFALISIVACAMDSGFNPQGDLANDVEPAAEPGVSETHFFYFSYDDSASTLAAELTARLLDAGTRPAAGLGRPWEFLSYEAPNLITALPTPPTLLDAGPFSLAMGMSLSTDAAGQALYVFGGAVSSPVLSNAARPPLVLTLVIDISGSMDEYAHSGEGARTKMELVRALLADMTASFKAGDVINIAVFTDTASARLNALAVGAEGPGAAYDAVVAALSPTNSTNLDAGLAEGYRLAIASFDAAKQNRVLIVTDAYANTGEVDPTVISNNVTRNGSEGILFSGIGVGDGFNEAFLNELTEAGKGAYFLLSTDSDAERIADSRFTALLSVAARDVRFRLDYPADLSHVAGSSEESSTEASEVQPTNFSYNTSQFFEEEFAPVAGTPADAGLFTLSVTWKDPSTGEARTASRQATLSELLGAGMEEAIAQARLVALLGKAVRGDFDDAALTAILAGEYPPTTGEAALVTRYRALINAFIALPEPTIVE